MQLLKTTAVLVLAAVAGLAVAPARLPAQQHREKTGATETTGQRITRLIEELGDDDYFVRERAQAELAKYSFEAFDALSAATTHEDLEIAARARRLLNLMRVEWTVAGDPPEVKELLKDYRSQSSPDRLVRMHKLAVLPGGAGIPALCRLIRYEKSLVLSKWATIILLVHQPRDEPPGKQLVEKIRKGLDGSRRTAAVWLLTWLRLGQEPEAALPEWTKLVEAEHALWKRSPGQTSPKIVAALVRLRIGWLKKLGRGGQATVAMRRLLDLEKGNPETLAELLDWLVEQKAWKVIDELAVKFKPQLIGNPMLVYTLAQAQAEQGHQQRAEETAERALRINPIKNARWLATHFQIAAKLRRRGLFKWAEREYRYVIDSAKPGELLSVSAQSSLCEMLHDQGENAEAAKVLDTLLEAVKNNPNVTPTGTAEIRSRMDYFLACHFKAKKDTARQREHLDKAIGDEAPDIDVLIACYRLADQTPEYRKKVVQLIEKEAAKLQKEIAGEPRNPSPYNQYAWLIGNTQGDFDKALTYSKKSLELTGNSHRRGGYLDTLAHVHAAKGDYENAVATQAKAAKLEPHSGMIARKLELFRKKLKENQGN